MKYLEGDVVCTAGCGECCMGGNWRYIFLGTFLKKGERLFHERGGVGDPWDQKRCFFNTEQGCELPRHERPNVCRTYFCKQQRCAA